LYYNQSQVRGAAISIAFDPLRRTWLASNKGRRETTVTSLLHTLDKDFFCAWVQALVPRWDRC